MAKMLKFDYSQFIKFAKNLKLDQKFIDKKMEEFILIVAQRALDKMKEKTPTGIYPNHVHFLTKDGKEVDFDVSGKTGGNLKRNWRLGSVVKAGNKYVVEIFNNTEYASYVNNGHRTPNHKGWVEGKFFVEISMQEIEKELPKYLEKMQQDILNKMFNGK